MSAAPTPDARSGSPDGAGRPVGGAGERAAAALGAVPGRVSLVCEADGTVVWVCPTSVELLGLSPEALVGTVIAIDPPRAGQPTYVLGGDGRPRRITVRVVDLREHPGVRGVLVEWELPVERGHDTGGLLGPDALADAVARLGTDVDRGIGVVRLRPHRLLPVDALAVLDERLRGALRSSDLAARLDDGDVVVVCPGHWTPASAAAAAQRLRSHVNGPVRAAEGVVAVRLDAGTATGTTSELPELLRRAAFALPPLALAVAPSGGDQPAGAGVDA